MITADVSPRCQSYTLEDDPEAYARDRGLVVVEPDVNELFVDIDSEAAFTLLNAQVALLTRTGVPLEIQLVTPSKSGLPNRHVYLICPGDFLNPYKRIALQALLGSDPHREALSLARLEARTERPATIFFEAPDHPRAPR